MLTAGTALGRYRIVDLLGVGGMGEVYRANDTGLGREVAIKVIPAELARDRVRIDRFEKEARAAGVLNHPGICAIYDVGSHDGSPYVVMELLEGESLRACLDKGTLPARKAIDYAAQIARALAAAHEKGVVHRDLKPDNLFLTRDGRVKVLDFGLAKLTRPEVSSSVGDEMSTLAATRAGAVFGTAGYMAPEQVKGEPADHRADLFALGSILYEFLTGKRAFDGATFVDVSYRILNEEPPPLSASGKALPPGVDHIVRHCLEKTPAERFQAARDLAFSLEEVGRSMEGMDPVAGSAGAGPMRGSRRSRALLVVAAVAVIAAAAFMAGRIGRSGGGVDTHGATSIRRQFDLVLPESLPLAMGENALLSVEQRALALSPRGDRLVYCAQVGATTGIVVADLVRGRFDLLDGTSGAFGPFVSPDGDWVGFLTATEVKKIPIGGGSTVTLADVDEPFGAAWVDAATILVSELQGLRVTLVRASGGVVDTLRAGDRIESPSLTPDRRGVLYCRNHTLRYLDLETGHRFTLTGHGRVGGELPLPDDMIYGFAPMLLSPGRLLYVLPDGSGTAVAVAVEPESLRPLGSPTEIAGQVRYSGETGAAQAAANSGILVYARTPGAGLLRLVRRTVEGAVDTLSFPAADYGTFKISPDGTTLAAVVWPPNGPAELWCFDLIRGGRRRVLSTCSGFFEWSPDGRSIYASLSGIAGKASPLVRVLVDGSAKVDTLSPAADLLVDVSRDGRQWVFREPNWEALRCTDSFSRRGIVLGSGNSLSRLSPDGRWLAITAVESGQSQVFVQSTDGPQGRLRASPAGGEEPRWSPDGSHVVYRYGEVWYITSFSPGEQPVIGKPSVLFEGAYHNVPGYSYDIFPDGSFLLLTGPTQTTATRLRVITNLDAPLPGAGASEN